MANVRSLKKRKKKSENRTYMQARIETEKFKAVRKKMRELGVTWDELVDAACNDFLGG